LSLAIRLACLVGATWGWLGCRPPPEAGARKITDLRDTIWTLVGGAADTVLLNPIALAAADGHVYVADLGGPRVLALDVRSGTLLWTFGRSGGGPGEFSAPGSLAVLPDGNVIVADRIGARITIISREGRLVATQAPALVYSAGMQPPFALVDLDAGSTVGLLTPWPAFDSLSALARQVNLSSSPAERAGCWVTLIAVGQFSRYDGEGFESLREYVERVPFPKVDTQVVTDASGRVRSRRERLARRPGAAQAAAAYHHELLVLFGGQTEDARRIIDVYEAPGHYRRSLRLGSVAHAVAADAGIVVVLTTMAQVGAGGSEDLPYPALVALRMP
jgi:outer membrane protein assembly factor BamB